MPTSTVINKQHLLIPEIFIKHDAVCLKYNGIIKLLTKTSTRKPCARKPVLVVKLTNNTTHAKDLKAQSVKTHQLTYSSTLPSKKCNRHAYMSWHRSKKSSDKTVSPLSRLCREFCLKVFDVMTNFITPVSRKKGFNWI